MTPMTPHQRRQIFVLCSELGWSDDMRRDMMREWVGKPSLASDAEQPIAEGEARLILANLGRAVAQARRERRRKGLRQRRIWRKSVLTPEQLRAIGALRRAVFRGDLSSFHGWFQRRYGVEDPAQLTPKQASACIVGLERMREEGWHPATRTAAA